MVGLSGAEIVTGIGLRATYTLLYPESIILGDDICHRARYALMNMDINSNTLALEVIQQVGSGGHFLAQKHTRRHMPHAIERSLSQQLDASSNYRDPQAVAREKMDWILNNHEPAPLEKEKKAELTRILKAAELEIV
jgi:trimethylamine--corrinoid protein Co-methyltransferase